MGSRLKFLLVIFVLISFMPIVRVFAASWNDGRSVIFTNDKVGIGVSSTNDPLHVLTSNTGDSFMKSVGKVYVGEGVGSFWLYAGRGNDGRGYNNISSNAFIDSTGWNRRELNKEAWVLSNYTTENNTGYFRIFHSDPQNKQKIDNLKPFFSLDSLGNLRIENAFTAREIRVQANPWADYVFEDNYKLASLNEVEKFIKENKRLPGIPSAKEISINGVSVGEMQRLQMEKIEELTLHLIQKEREINDLKNRFEKLENLLK